MKLFILLATTLLASIAHAETAQINVAERDCSNTSLSKLYQGQSYWLGTSTLANARENSDDSKCTQSDISSWLTTVSASCTTYFDVISITPITKGYAQFIYRDDYSPATDENARSGAYGYSYTDRLIMTYRCL